MKSPIEDNFSFFFQVRILFEILFKCFYSVCSYNYNFEIENDSIDFLTMISPEREIYIFLVGYLGGLNKTLINIKTKKKQCFLRKKKKN